MKKSYSSKSGFIFLVSTALLIALQIVLSRWLSIQLWNLKIGFSFVPVMVAAYLFGPAASMTVYGVGDIIGTLLFPTGPYFPGFTFSALLSGLIYGIFLHKKITPIRTCICVGLNQLICSFLLNSLWISVAYGANFFSQLAVRWPQSLGMGVVQAIFCVFVLEKLCSPVNQIIKKAQ